MEPLLAYKQEATCRARWLTTASGCRHFLIFNVYRLDERERRKLIRLISYVVSVYIPSFGTIQLKPSAAEGPGIALFQRPLGLRQSGIVTIACYSIDETINTTNKRINDYSICTLCTVHAMYSPTYVTQAKALRNCQLSHVLMHFIFQAIT